MASEAAGAKKYVVKLTAEEREHLSALTNVGKSAARRLLKARILLKADASENGDAWSDSQIAAALDASVDTIARTRQRFVEEGVNAALTCKHSPNSARKRIFDGDAEAKLIALACSKPPPGHAAWSLRLLEEHVVELHIVDKASDTSRHACNAACAPGAKGTSSGAGGVHGSARSRASQSRARATASPSRGRRGFCGDGQV